MMEGYFMQTCIIKGCGISWYQPTGFDQEKRRDHSLFHCPNGHGQYYAEKNEEEEKLKQQVINLERQLSLKQDNLCWCENSRRSLKGEITKLKKNKARR
jgi:hypothetical protein